MPPPSQRDEHLYLLTPGDREDLGLMVTVRLPAGPEQTEPLEALKQFFALLRELYSALGGSALKINKLREARLSTPRVSLGGAWGPDIPLDKFLATFTSWIAAEQP